MHNQPKGEKKSRAEWLRLQTEIYLLEVILFMILYAYLQW